MKGVATLECQVFAQEIVEALQEGVGLPLEFGVQLWEEGASLLGTNIPFTGAQFHKHIRRFRHLLLFALRLDVFGETKVQQNFVNWHPALTVFVFHTTGFDGDVNRKNTRLHTNIDQSELAYFLGAKPLAAGDERYPIPSVACKDGFRP